MNKKDGFTFIELLVAMPLVLLFIYVISSSYFFTESLINSSKKDLELELLEQELISKMATGIKPENLPVTDKNHLINIIGQQEGGCHKITIDYRTFRNEKKQKVIWYKTK